ncbi:MAG: hypothetical protein ACI88H_002856 [Cocleimonas sp.]|jgi:hypothetical protein
MVEELKSMQIETRFHLNGIGVIHSSKGWVTLPHLSKKDFSDPNFIIHLAVDLWVLIRVLLSELLSSYVWMLLINDS